MQKMWLLRSNRGFTLIEAMVVVAIVGIMSLVSYSGFSGLLKKEKVTAAANQLMGHIKEAKMFAMEKHVRYCTRIDGNAYTILQNTDNDNNCTWSLTEPIIHKVDLTQDFPGVTMVSTLPRFQFDTRGMPKNTSNGFAAVGITLTLAGKRQCNLTVSNSGRIDVISCTDL